MIAALRRRLRWATVGRWRRAEYRARRLRVGDMQPLPDWMGPQTIEGVAHMVPGDTFQFEQPFRGGRIVFALVVERAVTIDNAMIALLRRTPVWTPYVEQDA